MRETASIKPAHVVKILERAQANIQNLNDEERRSNASWTREIRLEFAREGKARGLYAYPDRSDGLDRSEWLYDVCWIDYGNGYDPVSAAEMRLFKSVLLAVECEWKVKITDFLDDFEKLLQVRSSLRVMIFGSDDPEALAHRSAQAEEVIRAYRDKREDDIFIVVRMYNDSKIPFDYNVILVSDVMTEEID